MGAQKHKAVAGRFMNEVTTGPTPTPV